eukprot:COSAG05_NODE_557_length_8701_cov_28.619972_5_plen_227_part_00
MKARAQVDICGKGMKAVICDERLRTYNTKAPCNTEADIYRWNPWRAPGTAPVFDPCGKAGGGYPGNAGPGAADFVNTSNAKHGDLGSEVLKPGPSQATWKAGSEVETVWGRTLPRTPLPAYTSRFGSTAITSSRVVLTPLLLLLLLLLLLQCEPITGVGSNGDCARAPRSLRRPASSSSRSHSWGGSSCCSPMAPADSSTASTPTRTALWPPSPRTISCRPVSPGR